MSKLISRMIMFLIGFGFTLVVGAPAWGALLGGWIVAGLVGDEE